VAAIGCGPSPASDDAAQRDASADDAAMSIDSGLDAFAGLSVSIVAPSIGYLDEETCVDVIAAPASATVSIVWGDGERTDAAPAHACHTYTLPGSILVGAIAEDAGMRAEATRTILVVPRPSDPRPTSSATIAYDDTRSRVWVVNPDHGTVSVLQHEDAMVTLSDELTACERPRTLSVVGAHVLVACQDDARLLSIDADAMTVSGSIALPMGSRPFGVALDPRGTHAIVTLQDLGAIAVIDVEGSRVLTTLEVGPDVRNVAWNADGDVLVTAWRGTSDGTAVYTLDLRDLAHPTVVGTTWLEVQRGIDSDTDNDGVPSFLSQVVFSPDGAHALIPDRKSVV
jgi:DNA-binding beta-propeller fold protein YncE